MILPPHSLDSGKFSIFEATPQPSESKVVRSIQPISTKGLELNAFFKRFALHLIAASIYRIITVALDVFFNISIVSDGRPCCLSRSVV